MERTLLGDGTRHPHGHVHSVSYKDYRAVKTQEIPYVDGWTRHNEVHHPA